MSRGAKTLTGLTPRSAQHAAPAGKPGCKIQLMKPKAATYTQPVFRQVSLTFKQVRLSTTTWTCAGLELKGMCQKPTFHRTLEWLCAQVGDAMTFQVLCSREGLPAAFHGACKPPIVVVLPARTEKRGTAVTPTTRRHPAAEVTLR